MWLTPGIVRPDGAGYLVYLPSTWFDRDLLFFDEWAQVGLIRDGRILFKDVTATGHLSNHWTAGASLVWYPAFVAGDVVARAIGEVRNGFSPPYVTAVVFTSALAGLFALMAGIAAARRFYGEGVSAAAAIAIWLGSPLAFYSLRHATMAHAVSAATCAGVVLLSLRLRERVDTQRLLACGLAIGLACAVRPQNIVIAFVPLLMGMAPIENRIRWKGLASRLGWLGAGALLAAAPQLIVSQTLWGTPLGFVNIGARAHPWQMFRTFRPFETIFSWYHGLATWTPLLLVALVGFAFLWRDDRGLARAAIFTFAGQWLVLSVLERWFWGGPSLGQRRFDSCTIFFILGLAAVLQRVPRWIGVLLTLPAVAWTMALFMASAKVSLNRYQPPAHLADAFRTSVQDAAWYTILGFAPPPMRGEMLLTMVAVTLLAAVSFAVLRRFGTVVACAYFVGMSAFFVWCGMHPRHDGFTRALIANPGPSGSVLDTITLLQHEADYMRRTGRPAEAEKALEEAAELQP